MLTQACSCPEQATETWRGVSSSWSVASTEAPAWMRKRAMLSSAFIAAAWSAVLPSSSRWLRLAPPPPTSSWMTPRLPCSAATWIGEVPCPLSTLFTSTPSANNWRTLHRAAGHNHSSSTPAGELIAPYRISTLLTKGTVSLGCLWGTFGTGKTSK
jgi:hypothetical protein